MKGYQIYSELIDFVGNQDYDYGHVIRYIILRWRACVPKHMFTHSTLDLILNPTAHVLNKRLLSSGLRSERSIDIKPLTFVDPD